MCIYMLLKHHSWRKVMLLTHMMKKGYNEAIKASKNNNTVRF